MKDFLVSILMLAYGHEKFISKAIESVLMQKTNFSYQLIIGEDFSIDNTREIVGKYAVKYPDKIRAIFNHENIGMIANAIQVYKACTGKYIAILEGDDHWTDPLKLQKQVDFLERNREYSICFHYVDVIDENNNLLQKHGEVRRNIYTQKDIFLDNKTETRTCSMLFRKESISEVLPEWLNKVSAFDRFWKLLCLENGNGYVLKESMAYYRKHPGGVWSTLTYNKLKEKKDNDLRIMIEKFGKKYPDQIRYAKIKHDLDFVLYYSKKNQSKKAWKIFLLSSLYPPLYLNNKRRHIKIFLILIMRSFKGFMNRL